MPVSVAFYLKLLTLLLLFIPCACARPVIPDEDSENDCINVTETNLFPGQLLYIAGPSLTACGWPGDSLTTGSVLNRGAIIALDHTSSAYTGTGGNWNFAVLARPKAIPNKATSRFPREWTRLSEVMFNVHALIGLMTEAESQPLLQNTFLNFCSLPSTNVWKVRRVKSRDMDRNQQQTSHSNNWAGVSDELVNALIKARSQDPDETFRSYSDASKEEFALLPAKRRRPVNDSLWIEVTKDSLSPGQIVYAKISSLKPHSRCGLSPFSPIAASLHAFIALNYVSRDKGGRWYFAILLDARKLHYRDLDKRDWVSLSKAMSDVGESDTFEKEDKGSFLLLNDALLGLAPDCFLENGETIKRLLKPGYIRETHLNRHGAATQMDHSVVLGKTPDPDSEAWLRVSKEMVNALIKTRPRTPEPYKRRPDGKRYSEIPTPDGIKGLIARIQSNPPDLGENVAPLTLPPSSIQGLQPLPKDFPAAIPGRPSPPTRRYSGTSKPPQKTDVDADSQQEHQVLVES
ncbi:hypothetical protein H0H93_007982 [Arthromyces matolae]|nr:hypothetical protein H0H93_007982 [Arthromyces matolae]